MYFVCFSHWFEVSGALLEKDGVTYDSCRI